ncbi:MAG: hypothetical protein ABH890_01710 [Bacillota bacterium]
MILTTNETFAHQITSPRLHVPKTYEIELNQVFTHHLALRRRYHNQRRQKPKLYYSSTLY